MSEKIHRNSLQPGHKLHWYRIEKILGQGGFGITYLAHDFNLDRQVAIKEYLPIELAVRERDFSVHPVTEDHGEKFRWGLDRFITEARTLAKFKHPNIVHVLNVFEENNTAYMVMEYEHGESLQDILTRRKTLEEAELTNILIPILGGLQKVHDAGFIHRDIKPANIFIREDGSPVLLDFGSARQALSMATQTLTSLVSPGYAPYEQYYSKSDQQGPWTDIYGLGATLYRAVAGIAPMDAVDRSRAILKGDKDIFVFAIEIGKGRYSERFLLAIDHALQFKEGDRPQTINAWKAEFNLPEDPIKQANIVERMTTQPGTKVLETQKRKVWLITKVAILGVLISVAITYFYRDEIQDYLFGPTKSQLEAEHQRVEQEKRLAALKQKEEEDRRHREEEKRVEEERQAELERQRQEEVRKQEAERLVLVEERKRAEEEARKQAEAEVQRQAELERQRVEKHKEELARQRQEEAKRLAELEKNQQAEEETNSFLAAEEAYKLGQYDKAIPIYESLANKGHAGSQYTLSHAYFVGNGVVKDIAKAEMWQRKAAEQGHLPSQYFLGLLYQSGEYGVTNLPEAFKWYLKAAEQGFPIAQSNVADMYRDGEGVPQNYYEALKWYNKAAEAGISGAQVGLGIMYMEGLGVTQDNIKAFAWISVAAAADADYVEMRNNFEKRISPAEIEQAHQLTEALWEKFGENSIYQSELKKQYK